VRFHRDIVWVHSFPNGNGCWLRLMADMFAVQLGQPRFTWGTSTLRAPDEIRKAYITAQQAVDIHNFSLVLSFARS
jgi:fido (protein-threonine AMPylation protein)